MDETIAKTTGSDVVGPDGRREEIARQLSNTSFVPDTFDIDIDLKKATKLPVGQLESLGSGLSALFESTRTMTQTVEFAGDGLLRAIDYRGNPIDPSVLFKAKDGTGILGGYRNAAGSLAQARFQVAGPQMAKMATKMGSSAVCVGGIPVK